MLKRRFQVIDLVTDMMQPASFFEEIANWRCLAGRLNQLKHWILTVRGSEERHSNSLYWIMDDFTVPVRGHGHSEFVGYG
jgi:hypothetical protein